MRGGISGIGQRKPPIHRNWHLANLKREAQDGCCLICGKPYAELAHLIGRSLDSNPPLRWDFDTPWKPYIVVPDRVILLCGPATTTSTCHGKHHDNRLNLLGRLDLAEEHQLLEDAGRIAVAYRLLVPEASFSGSHSRARSCPRRSMRRR